MSAEDEEEYRYAALVNRWQRERATTALTKMDGNFYQHFDQHLRDLVADYQKEHAVNPATPKVLILQDEMSNLQRVRDDIYDLRERKIVTAAVIAARGGNPDRANMTKEEELIFEELLRVLRDARRNVLLRGTPAKELPKPVSGPPTPPDEVGRDVQTATPASALGERAPGPEKGHEAPLPGAPVPPMRAQAPSAEQIQAQEDEEPKRLGPQRVLVRVTGDIKPFVASDMRQYHLQLDDIVALPREVAHALSTRNLAKVMGN